MSALVCGFGAGVLQIVPIAKNLSCCLIIPAAAVLAILLDRKSKNIKSEIPIELRSAALIGLFTGLYAAFFGSLFDVMITFITKSNDLLDALPQIQKMITELPFGTEIKQQVVDLFELIAEEIKTYGFSFMYTISVMFNNILLNVTFGIIGGLIGAQIYNNQVVKKFSDDE